jgi:hypothetical protein
VLHVSGEQVHSVDQHVGQLGELFRGEPSVGRSSGKPLDLAVVMSAQTGHDQIAALLAHAVRTEMM